ncbi:hypothetical protein RHMOL_Rhmol04G0014100 [Rhododendron molle]|uniref:Uncharacterized protein n=1 Tax=Rhododendron molle TaxID=49168 RepID=A0ACC0NXG2_RHOML|nr:hypothetical protein RHMOL_Rhmol04G0014100 [Rhododendron molle]
MATLLLDYRAKRELSRWWENISFEYWAISALWWLQLHDHLHPMDPSSVHANPSLQQDDDDWDTEGFVIPSFGIGDPDSSKAEASEVDSTPSSLKAKKEEQIYLGPHGAPPQSKQQELNSSGRKHRFKQKLKEADRRTSGTGRENRLENLRELVGGGSGGGKVPSMSKSSPRDWLDPHCHESQFVNPNLV